jgi:hypothetical protein
MPDQRIEMPSQVTGDLMQAMAGDADPRLAQDELELRDAVGLEARESSTHRVARRQRPQSQP